VQIVTKLWNILDTNKTIKTLNRHSMLQKLPSELILSRYLIMPLLLHNYAPLFNY